MSIEPGDLFEWVYKDNNSSVNEYEELYSYTMDKWVPCSGLCLCIGMNDDIIHWVSDKGLFHARADKAVASDDDLRGLARVIPRARG